MMEDGHAFLLQQKEDYRLKSQCPFVPEPLVKIWAKTGQNVRGIFEPSLMDQLALFFCRLIR